MKKVILTVLISILVSCTSIQYRGNQKILNDDLVSKITKGLSIEKVEQILGEPNQEYTAGQNLVYAYSFSRKIVQDKYVVVDARSDSTNLDITFYKGKVSKVDYLIDRSLKKLVEEDKKLNKKVKYEKYY